MPKSATPRPDRDHRPQLPLHERELWSAADLAQVLEISRKTVTQLNKEGFIPEPIRIKGLVRWRRREIIDWLDSDCPARGDSRNGRPWRWKPGAVVKLETYLATLKAECVTLTAEAAKVSELIEKGEKLVHLRR